MESVERIRKALGIKGEAMAGASSFQSGLPGKNHVISGPSERGANPGLEATPSVESGGSRVSLASVAATSRSRG
jgi:hypothetical protein